MSATNPVPAPLLALIRWANAAMTFAGLAYSAVCYRSAVRDTGLKLSFITTHDPLTGLWNRRQFCAMAEHELARRRRTGERVALMMIDVDRLLYLNQTLGHRGGDGVIERVGHIVKRNSRLHDVVARWGEDEFICLLPDTDLGEAMIAGERLRRMVESETPQASRGRYTVSVGITDVHAEERLTEALPRADRALRHSKREGRNRVRCIPARHYAVSSSAMTRTAA
jgi:diguanylate cyclase (GGDEF)-like protein